MQSMLVKRLQSGWKEKLLARTVAQACFSEALPDEKNVEEEVTKETSGTASSSSSDAVLSRWESMQQALRKDDRRKQVLTPSQSEDWLPKRHTRPSGGASKAAPSRPPQPADNGERAVLDWREALQQAQQLRESSDLRESALTDTFGRKHTYLRISLTEKCNLRCLYCMPEEGVPLSPASHMLSSEEVVYLAGLFASAGVNKIRLTGGEPTLRRDLVQLTGDLSRLPGIRHVGITSNGIILHRNLQELQANGLKLLNLSLDTLRPDRFEQLTRRRGLHRVLDTINHAVELGFDPVKVNVVLMRGVNDDEICDFVEMTRHRPINVRFIEYMPFDGNIWARQKLVSFKEMLARVAEVYPQGLQPLQDPKGEVAKNFRVPGFVGSVSFVTSMTSAFCGDCNRLRLMADGNLKVCLFGANEVSLRDALRDGASEEDLLAIMSLGVNRKKAAHAGMETLAKTKNRAMVRIGG